MTLFNPNQTLKFWTKQHSGSPLTNNPVFVTGKRKGFKNIVVQGENHGYIFTKFREDSYFYSSACSKFEIHTNSDLLPRNQSEIVLVSNSANF